jgi:DNA-binding LytR/AlgR family response regulator
MQQYNCIIVEDEPLAAEVLQDYIKQVPFLSLKSVCKDAIYAIDVMQKEKIDLIFLDIHLPKLKGLDFIRTMNNPPHIIITTAYHEYALQGYEQNVLDYLLKPVEFNRFLTAVNKLVSSNTEKSRRSGSKPAEGYMFFNVNKRKVRISLAEILYIESLKEYIRIVTKEKTIITKFQLGQVDEILSENSFLRIHRSYIVAMDKIDAFTATDVEINNVQIPIGRAYKEIVQSTLDRTTTER